MTDYYFSKPATQYSPAMSGIVKAKDMDEARKKVKERLETLDGVRICEDED